MRKKAVLLKILGERFGDSSGRVVYFKVENSKEANRAAVLLNAPIRQWHWSLTLTAEGCEIKLTMALNRMMMQDWTEKVRSAIEAFQ